MDNVRDYLGRYLVFVLNSTLTIPAVAILFIFFQAMERSEWPMKYILACLYSLTVIVMGCIEMNSIFVEVRRHRTNYYIVSFVILEILQWSIFVIMLQEVSNWEYSSQTLSKSLVISVIFVHFLHAVTISFNHFMLIHYSIQGIERKQLQLTIKLRIVLSAIYFCISFASIFCLFGPVDFEELSGFQMVVMFNALPGAIMLLSKGINDLNFRQSTKNAIMSFASLPPFFVPLLLTGSKKSLINIFTPKLTTEDFPTWKTSDMDDLLGGLCFMLLVRELCVMARIDHGWTHIFKNAIYIADYSETNDDPIAQIIPISI